MGKICIAGSRRWIGVDCIPQLYEILRGDHSLLDNASREFVVGDAIGIDTWATMLLQSFREHLGCSKVSVYHIGTRPRNYQSLNQLTAVVHVRVPDGATVPPFTYRDQKMIEVAGEWIGFWNGDIKSTGTLNGFEYARLHGIPARLYRWEPEKKEFILNRSAGVLR